MSPLTGQSLMRAEDPGFLTGSTRYTADIQDPSLEGAAFAAFVRSPYARARVVDVSIARATAAPGVLAVFTAADLKDLPPLRLASAFPDELAPPLLPTEEVGFAGQAVAVVVATSPASAVDGTELVEVEYEPVDPVLEIDEALEVSVLESTRVEAQHREERFSACDVSVEVRTWNPRQSPAPIEPRSVAAAWTPDGKLYLWAATQRPHGFRESLSDLLGIADRRIRVISSVVGGGFGGKVSRTAEEFLVPIAARLVGRPVRWNETRTEYFQSATQGRGVRVSVRLAGSRSGRFEAISVDLVKDAGAYPMVGAVLAQGYGVHHASGCYDIAHVEFGSVAVMTNRPSTSAFRGAGRAAIIAAIERTVDVFASEIGLDPAEVRRLNLIRSDAMPYRTASGATLDEASYPSDLEQALRLAGYEMLRSEQDARRRSNEAGAPMAMGIGIASYVQMTTGGGGEEASVRIEADGTASVVTGSTSQGHSHATTWAQIASDVLGIPPSLIRVTEGDTDAIGSGVGAVGSRSLQTAGLAVHNSASAVLERARSVAAQLLESAEVDMVPAVDGTGLAVVGTPTRSIGWSELAETGLGTEQELSCGEFYDTEGRNTFPSGCHVAVVDVDTQTGLVRLRRLIGVDDAGVRVNPMIVEGQIHGGMASGVAQVLGEEMAYDPGGTPITSNFADYAIGSIDQFPQFELGSSETATSLNALGFKGVGESGIVGAVPAVHNAVVDALAPLRIRHVDLPCTPARLWAAIAAAT